MLAVQALLNLGNTASSGLVTVRLPALGNCTARFTIGPGDGRWHDVTLPEAVFTGVQVMDLHQVLVLGVVPQGVDFPLSGMRFQATARHEGNTRGWVHASSMTRARVPLCNADARSRVCAAAARPWTVTACVCLPCADSCGGRIPLAHPRCTTLM